MRNERSTQTKLMLGLLLLLCATCPCFAIPAQTFINGTLMDEQGKPLMFHDAAGTTLSTVNLTAVVTFYTSETATVSIYQEVTTTTVFATSGGVFSVGFTLPDSLLALNALWYSLAIDSDQNGIDPDDTFEGRFQITAVPFALSAKPVVFYDTHGGTISTSSGTKGSFIPSQTFSPLSNYMAVAPFTTPPGGVSFNRMNIFIHRIDPYTRLSFGIYDQSGNLVVTSGRLDTGAAGYSAVYLEINNLSGQLLPSTPYFTAIMATNPVMLRNTFIPSVPLCGVVAVTPDNGLLPQTFAVGSIQTSPEVVPISITLSTIDNAASTQTLPNTRWIQD